MVDILYIDLYKANGDKPPRIGARAKVAPKAAVTTPAPKTPRAGARATPTVAGTVKPAKTSTAVPEPAKAPATTTPGVEYDYEPAGEKPGGEGWEQTKSGGWRRPKGMGGGAKGAAQPEVAAGKKKAPETDPTKRPSARAKQPAQKVPTATSLGNVFSKDPKDFKDHGPLEHYQTQAQVTSDPKLSQMHKEAIKDKTKGWTAEQHRELSSKLNEAGLGEHATSHASLADGLEKESAKTKTDLDEKVGQKELAEQASKVKLKQRVGKEKMSLSEVKASVKYSKPENWTKEDKRHKEVIAKKRAVVLRHKADKPIAPTRSELSEMDASEAKEARDAHKKAADKHTSAGRKLDKEFKSVKADHADWQAKHGTSVPDTALTRRASETKAAAQTKARKEKKDAQAAEDAKPKMPSDAHGHAQVQSHVSTANDLYDNVESHLDNPDLKEGDRATLEHVLDALGEHKDQKHIPNKEQEQKLKKLAGNAKAYGKKAYEAPEPEAGPPEPVAPSTAHEHAAVQDHVGRASNLHDNISSHLEDPELNEVDKTKLNSILDALADHKGQQHLPTKDQSNDLKSLEKLASKHGKEAYEAPTEAEPKEPQYQTGSGATAFASGRAFGQQVGTAATSELGGGAIPQAALNYASQGAVSMGHHLLHKDKKFKKPGEVKPKAKKEPTQSSLEGP